MNYCFLVTSPVAVGPILGYLLLWGRFTKPVAVSDKALNISYVCKTAMGKRFHQVDRVNTVE